MVERHLNQSVVFLDQDNKLQKKTQESSSQDDDVRVMDKLTEMAILDSTKYYNRMVNNMLKVCSERCISSFHSSQMTKQEKSCVENCQKKFYKTVSLGDGFIKTILNETKNVDLLSSKNEIDVLNSSTNLSLNKNI